MIPEIIKGASHTDSRGTLCYNNDFDASEMKRIYFIQNANTEVIRAWQGHKIQQRWFAAASGSFKILLIKIDNWDNPSKNLEEHAYVINAEKLEVLHVPPGYASSIQALEEGSKLLVMADYFLGAIQDEYRYESDYFMN